jgi:hypothetical protein
VKIGENSVNTPDLPPKIPKFTDLHGAKKTKRKRRRSRDSSPSNSGSELSSSSIPHDRKKTLKNGTDSQADLTNRLKSILADQNFT